MYEMKLVLATVLSHFQLALADRRPALPVRRGIAVPPLVAKWLLQSIRGRGEELAIKDKPPFSSKEVLIL